MICIFQYKFNGFVLPVASYAEVEPVFRRGVKIDISVAFDFDDERVGGEESGGGDVASGEAAVDEDGAGEVEVGAVGVPDRLLVITIPVRSHRLCDK